MLENHYGNVRVVVIWTCMEAHKIRRLWILGSWSYEELCVSRRGRWEQHWGWLQEQHMIETAEPFLKLHHHLVARRVSLFWFGFGYSPAPQTFSEDLNLIRANKMKGIKIKMKLKLHGNGKLCRNVQRWHTTTSQSHGWREEEIHLEENRTAVLTNLIKNVRFIIRAQALIQCIVTF